MTYTPIQDMPLGYHLNFTDPDGIALEFQAPNDVYLTALEELGSAPSRTMRSGAGGAELLATLQATDTRS